MGCGLVFNDLGATTIKELKKDPVDIFTEYATKKSSSFVKTGYVFSDFAKNLGLEDPSLSTLSDGLKSVKLAHAPGTGLKRWGTFQGTVSKWFKSKTGVTEVFLSALDLVNPVWESTELAAKHFVAVPKAIFNGLKGGNGAALVILQGKKAYESFQTLANSGEKNKTKIDDACLKIIYQVAYIAIGAMLVLSTFFEFTFAPLTWSILSVITVVFGYIDYYHENIGTLKYPPKVIT